MRQGGCCEGSAFEPVDEETGWEDDDEVDATFNVHDVQLPEQLTPVYRAVQPYVFTTWGTKISSRRHQRWNLEVQPRKGGRNIRTFR